LPERAAQRTLREARRDLAGTIQALLPYLCMALGLIERRRISPQELLPLLRKTMRQRSMASGTQNGYGAMCPKNKPP